MSLAREALVKFRTDFEFYSPRALRILDKGGQLVPLRLNTAQKHLHQRIEQQLSLTGMIRALVLKGRQQGVSSYSEGRLYWKTSGEFGKRSFILTHEDKATRHLFAMAKRYHNNCPPELRPHTKHSNATELVFDVLDSEYKIGTAKTTETGRSFTAQYFHGSEVAFWPDADANFAALGQAIPLMPGTEIILESTANGIGNTFHWLWQEAERGLNDYIAVFIPWMWQEEYRREVGTDFELDPEEAEYAALYGCTIEQMAWRRAKIHTDFKGDASVFDQEYPATPQLAFSRQAGDAMIPLRLIDKARHETIEAPAGPKIMGMDPSDGAKAALALSLRQGRKAVHIERYYGLTPMQQVAKIVQRYRQWAPDFANGDAGGVGSPIIDRANELLGDKINRVLFGERALMRDHYVLRRDEMWGEMRQWFLNDDPDVPDDDVLATDLSGPLKEEDSSMRVKLESKKAMAKRGLLSPDSGDALGLTFALPVTDAAGGNAPDPERPYDWRSGG